MGGDPRQRRFPASAFADKAERLSRLDRKRHPADGNQGTGGRKQPAAAYRKMHFDIVEGQKRGHWSLAPARSG
jgi:hypothetical protein